MRGKAAVINNMHEMHPKTNFLSDFILGSQDGLVNVLGIVLGVSAATHEIKILYVAALAALLAESISMGAVAYTSYLARRHLYQKSVEIEKREMKEVPEQERREVWEVFKRWGYRGKQLEDITDRIVANPKAWLEFMMSYELEMAPVKESQPRQSGLVVFLSTIFGSAIPLIPYIFFTSNLLDGAIAAVVLSGIVLFLIGVYEAKTTVGSLWRSGVQMLIIGLAAGFAGYLIGAILGAAPV